MSKKPRYCATVRYDDGHASIHEHLKKKTLDKIVRAVSDKTVVKIKGTEKSFADAVSVSYSVEKTGITACPFCGSNDLEHKVSTKMPSSITDFLMATCRECGSSTMAWHMNLENTNKNTISPAKEESRVYRVCYKVVGYPNGKLEHTGKEYFTDLDKAKEYAQKKTWESPTNAGIAWVEEKKKSWTQI